MQPRPPAAETAEARGAVEVWAIPARRMGCVMERMVVSGVMRWGVGRTVELGGLEGGDLMVVVGRIRE